MAKKNADRVTQFNVPYFRRKLLDKSVRRENERLLQKLKIQDAKPGVFGVVILMLLVWIAGYMVGALNR